MILLRIIIKLRKTYALLNGVEHTSNKTESKNYHRELMQRNE